MTRWLGPYSDYAYAGIRIVSGFLFACHGAQKLSSVIDANSAELLSLRGAAGVNRILWRNPDRARPVRPSRRFCRQWGDGLCLFPLARAAGVLADLERRRAPLRCIASCSCMSPPIRSDRSALTGYDEGRTGSDDQGLNHSLMSDLVSHAVCCLTEISILVAESGPMNTETISGPAVRAAVGGRDPSTERGTYIRMRSGNVIDAGNMSFEHLASIHRSRVVVK